MSGRQRQTRRQSSGQKRKTDALTIDQIHGAVGAHVCLPDKEVDSGSPTESTDEQFDKALHKLVSSTSRPKTEGDLAELCELISGLAALCDEDTNKEGHAKSKERWEMFTLAIVHKRFHLKSPEARAEAGHAAGEKTDQAETPPEDQDPQPEAVVAGDGERLIFYVAVACLLRYAVLRRQESAVYNTITDHTTERPMVECAVQCLCRLAPHAGGSRDVCCLIEHGVYEMLTTTIAKRDEKLTPEACLSSSHLVGSGIHHVTSSLQKKGGVYEPLEEMLTLASSTLDGDLKLIKEAETGDGDGAEDEVKLLSTFNVFLPHHDRGRSKKRQKREGNAQCERMSNRNFVQSVAEILIWSRTDDAMLNTAFSSAYEALNRAASSPAAASAAASVEQEQEPSSAKTCRTNLHQMQTIVRRTRKVLNSHSRSLGFMLSDQFAQDPMAIDLKMVKRAKAGDLARLNRLASKKQATRVLKLIHMRNTDPNRVVPVESVRDLMTQWVPVGCVEGKDEDEVRRIELEMQKAKVLATVRKLRSRRPPSSEHPVVVASLDKSSQNHAASILLAAAMSEWDEDSTPDEDKKKQRIFIRDRLCDVSSLDAVMESLNHVFVGEDAGSEGDEEAANEDDGSITATTKDVLNLIDRHVADGDVLVLFTSADLYLPQHNLEQLRDRGCTVHCHNADEMGRRLNREKAKTGDVTCSLMWSTVDDLDLHVVMPSGEEIYYGKKMSKCGLGCLDVDMNASSPYSKEPVENVFLGKPDDLIQAPKGKYHVFVQNYAYHEQGKTSTTPVPWTVSVRINGEVKKYEGTCTGTLKSSNTTVCEFEYKGRTIPFPKQQEASAFGSANLVNITASLGQTLESLCQLMRVAEEHRELGRVRDLVAEEQEQENEEEKDEEAEEEEETAPSPSDEEEEEAAVTTEAATEPEESPADSEPTPPPRPLVAAHGRLEVTNRDRLYMLVCRLPRRFHDELGQSFGGVTLMQKCASEVARRMMEDNVRVAELERSGYPSEVVGMVKEIMKKGSVPNN